MSTIKRRFYSFSNLPQVKVSPVGEKIYEWSYLDSVGELKTDKRNVYEQIQSCRNQTDYKKRIREGENLSDDGTGLYLDTRQFSGDYGDVNEYIANLANDIRAQLGQETNNGAKASEVAEVAKESPSNTSTGDTVDGEKGDGK